MNATVLADQEPALTPAPGPARPPGQPAGDDRFTALAWIAGGRTSADATARIGSITGWVARRIAGGLELQSADEATVRYLEVILDELAAERLARAEALASDMAELEADGWTQESARAALSLPEPRKPAAA